MLSILTSNDSVHNFDTEYMIIPLILIPNDFFINVNRIPTFTHHRSVW